VDANGAAYLHRAIEQQQHWRQAVAVRDGRQPGRDPDVVHLVDCGDRIRTYRTGDGEEFVKRLEDDAWV
jgi:hypothetical protein